MDSTHNNRAFILRPTALDDLFDTNFTLSDAEDNDNGAVSSPAARVEPSRAPTPPPASAPTVAVSPALDAPSKPTPASHTSAATARSVARSSSSVSQHAPTAAAAVPRSHLSDPSRSSDNHNTTTANSTRPVASSSSTAGGGFHSATHAVPGPSSTPATRPQPAFTIPVIGDRPRYSMQARTSERDTAFDVDVPDQLSDAGILNSTHLRQWLRAHVDRSVELPPHADTLNAAEAATATALMVHLRRDAENYLSILDAIKRNAQLIEDFASLEQTVYGLSNHPFVKAAGAAQGVDVVLPDFPVNRAATQLSPSAEATPAPHQASPPPDGISGAPPAQGGGSSMDVEPNLPAKSSSLVEAAVPTTSAPGANPPASSQTAASPCTSTVHTGKPRASGVSVRALGASLMRLGTSSPPPETSAQDPIAGLSGSHGFRQFLVPRGSAREPFSHPAAASAASQPTSSVPPVYQKVARQRRPNTGRGPASAAMQSAGTTSGSSSVPTGAASGTGPSQRSVPSGEVIEISEDDSDILPVIPPPPKKKRKLGA
ncbi:unnamed protein product [Peniophora sp. CBMAI 1063]|nr:unnamed protein product [Peniophora sp. CBMAI 1063]